MDNERIVDEALSEIKKEYIRAVTKFPNNTHNMNALTEEVGELAQALLQLNYEPHKGKTEEDVRTEAIQVAAVALKILLQGDSTLPKYKGLLN